MRLVRSSTRSRLAASLVMALGLTVAAGAADFNYPTLTEENDTFPEDNGRQGVRRSTWEHNTSLTFRHYLEPFRRLHTAHECRDSCVSDRRCTGWIYYHPDFRSAGRFSYRLQGVCVLGAGLKERSGDRPGRTAGEVRRAGHNRGHD